MATKNRASRCARRSGVGMLEVETGDRTVGWFVQPVVTLQEGFTYAVTWDVNVVTRRLAQGRTPRFGVCRVVLQRSAHEWRGHNNLLR